MEFLVAYHTDKGIRKKSNQDALLAKVARNKNGRIGLFVVCDGMGGLEQGELASATVIKSLSKWFDHELPSLIEDNNHDGLIQNLEEALKETNENIIEYGEKRQIRLGTTLTALLVLYDKYYTIQVGDSRAYKIQEHIKILTKDQTFVAREIQRGNITKEQAKTHPRRNVLLQCIGATKGMEPTVSFGEIKKGDVYMLCTDGFYHEISEKELIDNLNYKTIINQEVAKKNLVKLVELVKSRKEVDNITTMIIKIK